MIMNASGSSRTASLYSICSDLSKSVPGRFRHTNLHFVDFSAPSPSVVCLSSSFLLTPMHSNLSLPELLSAALLSPPPPVRVHLSSSSYACALIHWGIGVRIPPSLSLLKSWRLSVLVALVAHHKLGDPLLALGRMTAFGGELAGDETTPRTHPR